MSKHNNFNSFNFGSDNWQNENSDFDQHATQFDQELERLLRSKNQAQLPDQTPHHELLQLAMQLRQQAPTPLRPDPNFRAKLANDLRQRAQTQAQAQRTQAPIASTKRNPIFSFGWRLSGGVALATLALMTAVIAFNQDGLFKATPGNTITPIIQAANFTTQAAQTTLDLVTTAFSQPSQTPGAPLSTAPTPDKQAVGQNMAAFGQLPTSSYQPEEASANGKPPAIGPRIQPVNSGTTVNAPVLTAITHQPDNIALLSPTAKTVLQNTDTTTFVAQNTNALPLSYNLNTNLPNLATTGQVYRQMQPQISEAKVRALGQRFGMDTNTAKFNYQSAGSTGFYTLTENDKTLSLGSNGRLIYSEPKVTPGKTTPLSDAEAINAATAYFNTLGLSFSNSGWGTLQKTVFPVGLGDNSGLRFVNFSPVTFKGSTDENNFAISEAITLEVTVNANSQVTFFDSNLPMLIDEQGKLNFAPMEAAVYPLMTPNQLKAAIEKGQVNLSLETTLRMQQKNSVGYRPVSVNVTSFELAYAPTYNSEGRLHLMPIVLVHGAFDSGTSITGSSLASSDFQGYIIAVQSQYLQNTP